MKNFMKKIQYQYSLLLVIALGFIVSCKDESLWVYDTTKLPLGAYARMLMSPPAADTIPSFDATDFPFQAEIDGVTSADQVTSLDIQVRYLKGSDGSVIKDYVSLGAITSWAIEPKTTELPRGSVSFKGTDIRTALGLQPTDLVSKNLIEFATTLKLKDGRVYSAANYDPNMNNSFYLAVYEFITELK
jgi:hypothetical protein